MFALLVFRMVFTLCCVYMGKRYFAFYGDVYYPSGGMDDFVGSYETIADAKQAIETYHKKNRPKDEEW